MCLAQNLGSLVGANTNTFFVMNEKQDLSPPHAKKKKKALSNLESDMDSSLIQLFEVRAFQRII